MRHRKPWRQRQVLLLALLAPALVLFAVVLGFRLAAEHTLRVELAKHPDLPETLSDVRMPAEPPHKAPAPSSPKEAVSDIETLVEEGITQVRVDRHFSSAMLAWERAAHLSDLSRETLDSLEAALNANKDLLARLRGLAGLSPTALSLGDCTDCDSRYWSGAANEKKLLHLLMLDAVRAAQAGDLEHMRADFGAARTLYASLSSTPCVQLASLSDSRARSFSAGLRHVLSSGALSPEDLTELQASLAFEPNLGVSQEALRIHRDVSQALLARPEEIFELLSHGRAESYQRTLVRTLAGASAFAGLPALDQSRFLEGMDVLAPLQELPIPERLSGMLETYDEFLSPGRVERVGRFGHWFIAEAYRALWGDIEAEARMNNARAAIAVARYQSDHGSLPSDLGALVPEYLDALPVDICTGEPLGYYVTAEGYTVYSVGLDQEDAGGVENRNSRVHNDIALSVSVDNSSGAQKMLARGLGES